MDIEKKMELITRPPTEEVITMKELRQLLETKNHPVAYDGFEPSGMAHIATGLMRTQKLKDMLDAGVKFKMFIADWHAWINNKMGGDLKKIKQVGKYFQEMWGALGVDPKKIEYIWASELVDDSSYWEKVVKIARITTIKRTKRCMPIMGRTETDVQYTAQFYYPMMQAADIFHMNIDICQLGMDQRSANILAREVGPKLGWWTPVAVHHHMLMGLTGPDKMGIEFSSKMSKSKPMSSIFVHDSPELIKKKISKAFCPEKQVEGNPLIEYCRYLIFPATGKLKIQRPAKFGGDLTLTSQKELESLYRGGKLHPADLKSAVAQSLIDQLKPVRDYFQKHPKSMQVFEKTKITR